MHDDSKSLQNQTRRSDQFTVLSLHISGFEILAVGKTQDAC